jgi:Mg-chelatase subunit ChlD
MSSGRGRAARWTATVAGGVVTALLAAGQPVAAAPATLDEVYAKLGVDQVPSQYVVMVDVSGSMNGDRYAQVRRSLTGFFAALAPEDQVR